MIVFFAVEVPTVVVAVAVLGATGTYIVGFRTYDTFLMPVFDVAVPGFGAILAPGLWLFALACF